jgi:hypothetical protein
MGIHFLATGMIKAFKDECLTNGTQVLRSACSIHPVVLSPDVEERYFAASN